MAEIAIISVKRTHLRRLKEKGSRQAELALELTENPNRFFSTIQVGITLIGILTGAFGGITLSEPISLFLQNIGLAHRFAETLSFSAIVIIITYLSLVIGELVPKRLGLHFSERLALVMAEAMYTLSYILNPMVVLLSRSTDFVLKIMQVTPKKKIAVSEEEVRMLIREGTQLGIFEVEEKNIVEKVLNIGDAKVKTLMKARSKVVWLDINAPLKEIKDIILAHQFSYFPVSDGNFDSIVGILRTDMFLAEAIKTNDEVNIHELLHKPLLIPENKKVLEALELFKQMRVYFGIIIDEYGSVEGIITLTDILESIVGDLPNMNDNEERQIIRRGADSWYIDGLLPTAEFKTHFHVSQLSQKEEKDFNTIGGFIMNQLDRVPITGDKIMIDGYTLEVADMDGNRVDKILLEKKG